MLILIAIGLIPLAFVVWVLLILLRAVGLVKVEWRILLAPLWAIVIILGLALLAVLGMFVLLFALAAAAG